MDGKGKNLRKVSATAKSVTETIPPPPPGFVSPFESLTDWLSYICENNQISENVVSEYHFGLLTSPGDNLIFLLGYNTSVTDENLNARRIVFTPKTHTFFALPNKLYGNMSDQQLSSRLFDELREFVKTPKFQKSFLSKGHSITTNFGDNLWMR
jgi:hypothetical protein